MAQTSRVVMTYRNGVTAVDPDWVDQRNYIDKTQSVLPDVARMAEAMQQEYLATVKMTKRIWNETEPIEY